MESAGKGGILADPVITALSRRYGKTRHRLSCARTSSSAMSSFRSRSRYRGSGSSSAYSLGAEDVATLRALDRSTQTGPTLTAARAACSSWVTSSLLHLPDGPAAQARNQKVAAVPRDFGWIHEYDVQQALQASGAAAAGSGTRQQSRQEA
jgi:hypothetical protein